MRNDVVTSLEELLDQSLMKQGACFEGAGKLLYDFLQELGFAFERQVLISEELQPLESAAADELNGVHYWKKVSAVFFIAAAATSGGLRRVCRAREVGRFTSELKKREGAVKRRKEITRVMIVGAKIAIKELGKIFVLARGLQFHIEAMSKLMANGGGAGDVIKKMAALGTIFRGIRDQSHQTNGYNNY